MKGRTKKADTFLVKIMDHEHATWQGKVTWIEGQREHDTSEVHGTHQTDMMTAVEKMSRNGRRK